MCIRDRDTSLDNNYSVEGMMITPDSNYFGDLTVPVHIDDGQAENSQSETFDVLITVTPVNDIPVADEISVETDEDIPVDITLTGFDTEGSELAFEIMTNPLHGTLSGETPNLTYTPSANYYGDDYFTYRAFDGVAFSEVVTFSSIIRPVNDSPVITGQVGLETSEDIALEITFSNLLVTDVDNSYPDGFTLSLLEGDNYTVDSATLTPDSNYFGDLTVPVHIDDGEDENSQSDTFDLSVSITPVNDAPVLTDLSSQATDEDVPLTITLTASDVENDDLTYSAVSDNENISISVSDDQLTMTPVLNFNGSANVTVTVNDLFLTDEGTFLLTLNSLNDPPEVSDAAIDPSVPSLADDLNLSYDYFDVDGDIESGTTIFWFKDDVEQVEFANQLTIPGSATACDEVWNAEIIPMDGAEFGSPVFSNNVSICAENTSPQWSEIDDQHINEDSGVNIISMEGLIEDAEQDLSQIIFTVQFNSDPVHLDTSFVGSDLILTTLIENYYTTEPIQLVLRANDGEYIVFKTINVNIDMVNDAPILAEVGAVTTDEDTPLTIALSASDVDGDDIIFSAESYSEYVSVNVVGDQLTMTPALNFNGAVDISVAVSDGGFTDSEIFEFVVNSVNDAPILAEVGAVTTDEDTPLTIALSGSDVDGDNFSLTAESSDESVTVSMAGDQLIMTPALNFNGSVNIAVVLSDGELTDSEIFEFTVNPVNDSPDAIDDVAMIFEDNFISGNVMENDSDLDANFNDPVEYSDLSVGLIDSTENGTCNLITDGSWVYTPYEDWYGTDSFTYELVDAAGENDQATVTITVNPVNDAPVLSVIGDQETVEDVSLTIVLNSEDIDSDSLTFSAVSGDISNVTVEIDEDQLTMIPEDNWNGSVNISVTVTDDELDDSEVFTFIVTPVNDPPVINLPDEISFEEDDSLTVDFSSYVSDIDEDGLTLSVSDMDSVEVSISEFIVSYHTPCLLYTSDAADE